MPLQPDPTSIESSVSRVRRHFDLIADAEWDRLLSSPRGRVSFELHRRMLMEFVEPGMRVLEVGAGPGRFTIELARLGARVTTTDVSDVQVALNARHVREAGCDDHGEARFVLDVRATPRLGEGSFDAVVAYGGPLSYVFDDAEEVFAHLARAVRPGGVVLASVMSLPGSVRYFLPVVQRELEEYGSEVYDDIMASGDLREIGKAVPESHTCRMFRWREIDAMIVAAGCTLLEASASNWMSLGDQDALAQLERDPRQWQWFLEWEARLTREPGALDGGTHVVFAARPEDTTAP
jgi:2-polyprenyl-3-methyl-5-hydroxy-6-metoxy-1,4-benzoquinol methylase